MPGAHDEIRTLLPPTLRLGTGRAVTALATELRDGEQAISLVSGSVDALPRAQRTHLLCVTDQALLLASVTGGSARRFDYSDLESFSSRNSNPGSYALDFVTLGILKVRIQGVWTCEQAFRGRARSYGAWRGRTSLAS